ncbi:hypothetical protein EGW08_020436 [Elysia chlorotica]|uniref:SOCS box domain-containing protein n=1 Tax=Elysia chlorotica TaxID=188477 RepID=A0A3S0Z8H9_ELYCH|nr:hypothetical protein EGW08_020436 [Elysia chlorotica]
MDFYCRTSPEMSPGARQGPSAAGGLPERRNHRTRQPDSKHRTDLMTAAENGWTRNVEDLLKRGDNIYTKDGDGDSALDLAIRGRHEKCIVALLNKWRGLTKRHAQSMAGRQMLNVLLQVKDVWGQLMYDSEVASTVLNGAIEARLYDLVKALITSFADGHPRCGYIRTLNALNIAMSDTEMLRTLLGLGVDINSDCVRLTKSSVRTHAILVGQDSAAIALIRTSPEMSPGARQGPSAAGGLPEMRNHRTRQPDSKHRTDLMTAAENGWTRNVDDLLKRGDNIYTKDGDGDSALDLAIRGRHEKCIVALLNKWRGLTKRHAQSMAREQMLNVLLQVKHVWGQLMYDSEVASTVLNGAIEARLYDLVKALIPSSRDRRPRCGIIRTTRALDVALSDTEMLRTLLGLGVDINSDCVRLTKHSALTHAVLVGVDSVVVTLLRYADPYWECPQGHTALTLAVLKDSPRLVSTLLRCGVDVNHVTRDGLTALWCSVKEQNFSLTKLLVQNGADVNFAGYFGVTVFMQAVGRCAPEFSELLLRAGGDINAQDCEGNTALFQAVKNRSPHQAAKVSMLLQHGARVNHKNIYRHTPLIAAVNSSIDPQALKLLLARRPDLDARATNGQSAVLLAARDQNLETLGMLVRSGADVDIRGSGGITPLMEAVQNIRPDTIEALLKLGANPTLTEHVLSGFTRFINYHCVYGESTNLSGGYYGKLVKTMSLLLEAGSFLDGPHPPNMAKFVLAVIQEDDHHLIPLLLQSGIVPDRLEPSTVPGGARFVRLSCPKACRFESLLCTAILLGRPTIVTHLARACLFRREDVKMLQCPQVKARLAQSFPGGVMEDKSPLETLSPRQWSLRTWSKMAVQRAVGFGQGREQRVRALPLPNKLKEELLFKSPGQFQW